MNYYLKVLIASFSFIFLCIEAAYPYIFVYKVTADNKTFITASHLSIDAFMMYNGGKDIVKKIKVLDIYDDNDFSKAIDDYDLKPANTREVPHEKADDNNTDFAPFIWWR
jgi:hypothetical protein